MNKDVWWSPTDKSGLEYLNLRQTETGFAAESTILRIQDGAPFYIEYKISGDEKWRVNNVSIQQRDGEKKAIKLSANGTGNWTDEDGERLKEFDGCIDVDISATPFTNTLPIRRRKLAVGDSAEISVVYFLIPEMTAQRSFQRYTRLEKNLFKFEENGIFNGFSANLEIDEDGLINDYPELFKRI